MLSLIRFVTGVLPLLFLLGNLITMHVWLMYFLNICGLFPPRKIIIFLDLFLFEKYVKSQFNKKIKFSKLMRVVNLLTLSLLIIYNNKVLFTNSPVPMPLNRMTLSNVIIVPSVNLVWRCFFHSGVLKYSWVKAFALATFLINRLSTTTLDLQSPFFKLYRTYTDYRFLRVFGSKYYPYIWDTKQKKIYPKTLLCAFLGHNDKHRGYKCYHPLTCPYHPLTCHTYISHHAVFDEYTFPYK